MLSWLHKVVIPSEGSSPGNYQPLLRSLRKVLLDRGERGFIEYCKNTRLALLHYLSGEFPEKRVVGIALTRDGLPKVLGPLIPKLKGYGPFPLFEVRMVLTILFCTRALSLGDSITCESIVKPHSLGSPDISSNVKNFWVTLGYRFLARPPSCLRSKKYHFTTKKGPNGHALWYSLADLFYVKNSRTHLFEAIKELGGKNLARRMDHLTSLGSSVFPPRLHASEGASCRKITWIKDKELKMRPVAILDYFSQCALRPLHFYLFNVLRKIPQDCTFDQGSFKDKING